MEKRGGEKRRRKRKKTEESCWTVTSRSPELNTDPGGGRQGRPHSGCFYRTLTQTTRTASLLSFTINDKHRKISRVIRPSLRRQEATEQAVCQSEAGVCASRIAGAQASVSCIGRLNKRTVTQSRDSPAASESTGRQRHRS